MSMFLLGKSSPAMMSARWTSAVGGPYSPRSDKCRWANVRVDMLPYWLVFFPFALGSISHRFQVRHRLGPVLLALLFGLTLFVGMRYHTGADYDGYELIYKNTMMLSLSKMLEATDRGFYTLVWALHQIDVEMWLLNLVCAIIFMVGLGRFAREMPNPWLTVVIALPYLIFVIAMSGIRQASAIGLFYLSIVAYRERRLVAAIFWLCAAASFHASAIVMLGVAGLSFSRNKFQAGLIILLTIFVGYYVLSATFDIYTVRYGTKQIQSSGTIYRVLMNLAAAIPYLILRKRFPVLGEHETKFWTNMSWRAIASLPAAAVVTSSTALDRFGLYLFPLQTYALSWLPMMFSKNGRNTKGWTILIVGYSALILLVFLGYGVNAKSSIPYRIYPLFGD
jgi:hypothetical protein